MSWNKQVMRCLNLEKLVGWNMGENVIGHYDPNEESAIEK
jgi:hypothetical protein